MVVFKTIEEHLEDLILGKAELPICTGQSYRHEPTKYVVTIGKSVWGLGCPFCGHGSGGSLREAEAKRLRELQLKGSPTKETER